MSTETLNLIVTGLVASQALVLAVLGAAALRRSPGAMPVMAIAITFVFYAATPLARESTTLLPLQITMFFEAQIPVLFWYVCESLFRDDFRWRARHGFGLAGPLASALHVLMLGREGADARATEAMAIEAVKAIHFICLGLGLREVVRGWSAELVHSRRIVRMAVMTLSGVALLLLIWAGYYRVETRTLDGHILLIVNIYALCTLFGANAFVIFHPDLLQATAPALSPHPLGGLNQGPAAIPGHLGTSMGAARPLTTLPQVQDPDSLLLEKLAEALTRSSLYTQEGLTLSELAKQLKTPEYRLRKVINESLGFRNFNQFLAHHRIAHAKRLLEDPAWQREKIISIALEVGYASLAPFNKAFKDLTGLPPSEYRRQAQGAPEPGTTNALLDS